MEVKKCPKTVQRVQGESEISGIISLLSFAYK